jgi:hypothetical protein
MAAAGLVEDEIALRLGGLHKNDLRRHYIDEVKQGRERKRAARAAAEAVSKEELERIAVIEMALASHWTTPEHGCLLYGGARTVAEALKWLAEISGKRLP